MDTLARVLLISAIVLFVLVFYRWLLRYLKRGQITEPYPYLYPFDAKIDKGELSLKLDLPNPTLIKCELRGAQESNLLLEDKFDAGIHNVSLDLKKVQVGAYDLKIIFPNQIITRPLEVLPAR